MIGAEAVVAAIEWLSGEISPLSVCGFLLPLWCTVGGGDQEEDEEEEEEADDAVISIHVCRFSSKRGNKMNGAGSGPRKALMTPR